MGGSSIFWGGGAQKNNVEGELSKKGDNLQGAWCKIRRMVFLSGWEVIPQCILSLDSRTCQNVRYDLLKRAS